ncbi:hypothetical protein LY76DRAFT_405575 [Colletotrichum caudatum]|nr:hypothetical protein LY76DRAFT_405575 [Colletotrichum caudatum]
MVSARESRASRKSIMSVVFFLSPSPSLIPPPSSLCSLLNHHTWFFVPWRSGHRAKEPCLPTLADGRLRKTGEGVAVCVTDSFANKHLGHHVHFVSHCATSSDKTSVAATRKSGNRPQARGGRERGRDILRGINRIAETGSYGKSFGAARCPISPTRR